MVKKTSQPYIFNYDKKSCEALKATIEKADPNSNVTMGGFKFQDQSYSSLWYDSTGEYNIIDWLR